MSTCCSLSSSSSLGNEAVSLCTECASVTVAGASLSLPAVLAVAAAVATFAITSRAIRLMWQKRTPAQLVTA